MEITELLKAEFNGHISFKERRPGIYQVVAPLFHEDGDMVDIYIDLSSKSGGPIQLSDHGLTLMRLSYAYDVDTPTKRKILDRIISENGLRETEGRLTLEAEPSQIYPALLQFAQAIAKVSSMRMFKREVIQNLFYEMLNEYVSGPLAPFAPQAHYYPNPDRDDLDVDWRFPSVDRDVFLFAVKDAPKARLVGLTCLEFRRAGIPFRSLIVHEDLENGLGKKDQRRITNIADKQFATLSDFIADGEQYLARELRTQ